jgi:hypothetical protein
MSVADGSAVDLPDRATRADAILAGMPLLFAGGYGVGAAVFGGWVAATANASLACAVLMLDAIVRNPPRAQ